MRCNIRLFHALELTVFLTLVGLFLPLVSQAQMSCRSLYSSGKAPTKVLAKMNSSSAIRASKEKPHIPTESQEFAEIWVGLNSWKGDVVVDKANETVVMDSAKSQSFVMKLEKPFTSVDDGLNPMQDIGGGLQFRLHSNQQDVLVQIGLSGVARHLGVPFTAVAQVKLKKGEQIISIPWEKFLLTEQTQYQRAAKLETENGEVDLGDMPHGPQKAYPLAKGEALMPHKFAIEQISFQTAVRAAPAKISLKGSIYRDFSLDWLLRKADEFVFANDLNLTGSGMGGLIPSFVQRLRSTEAQNYALEIIAKGDKAIEQELKKYGYEMVEINGKKTVDEFFNLFHTAYGAERYGKGMMVPVESGDFAKYHGRYTHVAQILTLLYKADKRIEGQLWTMNGLFSSPQKTWRNTWNILFDAPGAEGPNTPLWWVELFKARGIKNEPASGI